MNEKSTAQANGRLKIFRYLLVAWLLARLLFAVPLFESPERVRLIENNTYLELAEQLIETGEYRGTERADLYLIRTPVYPYFAAGVLSLFGSQLPFLALAQLALTAGSCWLVYLGIRHVYGPRPALAAAWLFALDPNAMFISLTALTETLFVFWLADLKADGRSRMIPCAP